MKISLTTNKVKKFAIKKNSKLEYKLEKNFEITFGAKKKYRDKKN